MEGNGSQIELLQGEGGGVSGGEGVRKNHPVWDREILKREMI